jgi:hypothetical protein
MIARSDLTRRALIASVLLAMAGPALASSPKKKEGKEGEAPAPDPIVKLQPIAIPIILDGRLLNYVFVNLSLKLAPTVPATVMAGKEPFLRDAIVKAAHDKPFTAADTYNEVDAVKLKAFVMSQAVGLVGKGKVASVDIVKQIARRQLPLPARARRPSPSNLEH